MKRLALVMLAASTFAACNNRLEGDKAATTDSKTVQTGEGEAYSVDSSTTITWMGSKPTGQHEGIFKVQEGKLLVKDNALTGGSFLIDMNSLNNLDLTDAEYKAKLEGHLKSPDFFDVAKFPTAKFEITGVENFVADSSSKDLVTKDATHLIKGNLTLKDSTKNISFPATITASTGKLIAAANFNIDRTEWGMNYKGPNNPQDWVINKTVNIKLNLSSTKK